MALNARKVKNNSGPKAPPIEVGSYPARLVQVIDMGLQKQRPYQGQEKKPANEIMLTYELVDEFMKDENGEDIVDKPRWISETIPLFSLEAERAKSTQRYYALDPEEVNEGDFTQLLDTPCMVTVVQNKGTGKNAGNVYNNIGNVSSMRPREAAKLPKLVNEKKYLSLDEDDVDTFLSLPEWVQDKIKEGLEFEGSVLGEALKRSKGKNEKTNEKKPNKNKEEEVDEDTESDDEVENEEEENW